MTWNMHDYPDMMENLEGSTREKAIEIANSLIKDDYEKPRAIIIAITQAKRWTSKKENLEKNNETKNN